MTLPTATWHALGTTVVVAVTDEWLFEPAVGAVAAEIAGCDRACSRFRADSELSLLNSTGRLDGASEWLVSALEVALEAARVTDGLVDPTVGRCLVELGYDRSFEHLDTAAPLTVTATHRPAWQRIEVDRSRRSVRVPKGVVLDLGATAKALCADRAAAAVGEAGILVSLGGDIAVAGVAPDGGWPVRVTDRSDADPATADGQTVSVSGGGLATSGTSARHWGAGALHHLVDPRTARPAAGTWRSASVAAPTCVAANTASTAAMVLGAEAPGWLADRGYDARLVDGEGVTVLGGWPAEASAGRGPR